MRRFPPASDGVDPARRSALRDPADFKVGWAPPTVPFPATSMPNYRRAFQPGGTFFFSIISYQRAEMFRSSEQVNLLRAAALAVMKERPFIFAASVILPDH